MKKRNPHRGSSFESWLEEAGIRDEMTTAAIKAVVARHFARRRLSRRPGCGILDDDRTVLDLFEPIVRYGRIDADALR